MTDYYGATTTYVYDNGDNLLTKKTPKQENFDDKDISDWSAAAGYTAANGYMENNDTSRISFGSA